MKSNMKSKICTSIEQSKKLIELGIPKNTADIWYQHIGYSITDGKEKPTYFPMVIRDNISDDDIPAWSLFALLELMPERIKIGEELSFCLTSKKSSTGFSFGYNLNGSTFVKDNPLDAAFEIVCWLKENNKI